MNGGKQGRRFERKVRRNFLPLCLILWTYSFHAQSVKYEPSSLKKNLDRIKEAAARYELDPTKAPLKLTSLPIELGQYHSEHFLLFYQAISLYLRALDKKTPVAERANFLVRGLRNLSETDLTYRELGFDQNLWYERLRIELIRIRFAQKSYFQVIKHIGLLNLALLKDEQIYQYVESLRATNQMERLRRVLQDQQDLISRSLDNPILKPKKIVWQKLLKLSQAEKTKPASKPITSVTPVSILTAIEKFDAFLKNRKDAPFDKSLDSQFKELFQIYLKQKKKPDALNDKLVSKFEAGLSQLDADQLLFYLRGCWKADLFDEAISGIQVFLEIYHGHPAYPEMLYDKGRLLEEKKDYEAASSEFLALKDKLKGTKLGENAAFRQAMMAKIQGDKDAAKLFEAYWLSFPDGRFVNPSVYFALSANPISEEAKALAVEFVKKNPMSYYAFRLSEVFKLDTQLILSHLSQDVSSARVLAKEHPIKRLSIQNDFTLALFHELQELGLNEEAYLLAANQSSSQMTDLPMLAYLLEAGQRIGNIPLLNQSAIRIYGKFPEVKDRLAWRQLFPAFQKSLIVELLGSNKTNLSYEFVASLIRQESGYVERARSRAKAIGLMQLIDPTAKLVANKMGIKHYNLFSAHSNIQLGIGLVRQLHAKYNGRLDYVLAAYNAGESVTDEWVRRRGHLPQELFIELIPYEETRKYVTLIFRNMAFYKMLANQMTAKR